MKKIKNHVQLVGRLGAKPQVKVLESGSKVARFSVAVTNTYTNKKGERVTDVQWHAVSVWDKLADVAEKLLHKGTQVTLGGKLNVRSFVNKQGIRRSSNEIVANELFVPQTQLAIPA